MELFPCDSQVGFKWQSSAILALQEATEAYMVYVFEMLTLMKKDMELANRLRGAAKELSFDIGGGEDDGKKSGRIWCNTFPSSYQNKDHKVNERTYSHNVANALMDFMLYDVKNIEERWDGCTCQSTDFRNNVGGPTKFPDFFSFFNFTNEHHFDFLFCEISNGPFPKNLDRNDHVLGDLKRLEKIFKDSFNHSHFFFKKHENYKQLCSYLDQLKRIMVHFHETSVDFYILDRHFYPFYRMSAVKTLTIPLFSDQFHVKYDKIVKLCETLLSFNNIISYNFRLLLEVESIINLSQSTPPHQTQSKSTPPFSGSLFRTYNS
nr:13419_t:CDS:2 [Entrophospora candida]